MGGRREFERTHPWLTFSIDLRRAPAKLWMALGEAQSKCEHIAGSPLRPDVAEELHTIYLAKGIQGTTAIEGNTLTEREVRDRIDGKRELPPSREYLGQEVDNIIDVANHVLSEVERDGPKPLTADTLQNFNRAVLRKLELETGVIPGRTRKHSVGVGGYRAAPHQDCDYLLERLCEWLDGPEFQPEPGLEIVYGIIKSVIAHIYFVWIHPFDDGNGRTARLIEVKFLLEADVSSAAAHLLSNHYNLTRSEYYKQLDKTSKSGGDIIDFLQYAVNGFVDQLREHIRAIKYQQYQTTWVNYVHDVLGEARTPAERRQLRLVLALSKAQDPVNKKDMRHLTVELAEDYAGKTPKTLTRDLNALVKKGLIVREADGYKAQMEKLLAFLPRRIKGSKDENETIIVEDQSGQLRLLL